jgi:hypothetical protein
VDWLAVLTLPCSVNAAGRAGNLRLLANRLSSSFVPDEDKVPSVGDDGDVVFVNEKRLDKDGEKDDGG